MACAVVTAELKAYGLVIRYRHEFGLSADHASAEDSNSPNVKTKETTPTPSGTQTIEGSEDIIGKPSTVDASFRGLLAGLGP